MNLSELKTWAQQRYQEETRKAEKEHLIWHRSRRVGRADAYLEIAEKIEEGERE